MNQNLPINHISQEINSQSSSTSSPELTMDKKNSVPPSRSNSVASFQRHDGSGGNQLSKSYARSQYRNRGQPSSSNGSSPKQDASGRRPYPQKNKYVDKRPRPRSLSDSEQVVQNQSEQPEVGSLQSPGSKKQNLNHLLNFHFAPREHRAPEFNRGHGRANVSSSKATRPKYWKESFIQANCQFLVKPSNEFEYYGAYKYDPDHLVDWDSIEQIVIRTYGGMPNCPICLEPYPCAAKMTKCGHIFCWPCCYGLAFHLEGSSQPCPICFEPVTLGDLKSVVANLCEEFHVGEELEFQLICRPKDSSDFETPVIPDDGNWERRFRKLVIVDKNQVKSEILDREEAELSQRLSEELEGLEGQFVTSALQELENRKQLLMSVSQISPIPESPEESDDTSSEAGVKDEIGDGAEVNVDNINEAGASASATTSPDWSSYYIFYQAADGRCAYVNQLNMAMLWKSFGDNPFGWPQRIRFKILEVEYITMTIELRKRFRSLQHIPLNTCLQLVEVELGYPLVSEEVLKDFAPQLNLRKKRRIERVKAEKRREREHAAAEKRKYPPLPKICNSKDFPSFGAVEEENVAKAIAESLKSQPGFSCTMDAKTDAGHETDDSSKASVEYNGSFRSGSSLASSNGSLTSIGIEPSSRPKMSYCKALSAPAPQRASGWKNAPVPPSAPLTAISSETSVRDGESGEESRAPSFQMSMNDAISKALEGVRLGDGQAAGTTISGTGGNGQKKKGKKNKKNILLFATGMDMGHN